MLRHSIAFAAAATVAAFAAPRAGAVEANVPQRLLSGVTVAERNACAIVKIDFNSHVQYTGHQPLGGSDELRILLKPVDTDAAGHPFTVDQESLRAPVNERASLHAIELAADPQGAALMLYFKHAVAYKVAPGPDSKSVLIAVPGPAASAACLPAWDDGAVADGGSSNGNSAGTKNLPSGVPAASLDAMMAEARAALTKGDAGRALELLKTAAEASDTRYVQEAKELTGVAHEKKGLIVGAKQEYQEYLTLYPKGPGADRVRARLAAIEQSGSTVFEQLKKSQADANAKIPPPIGDGKNIPKDLAAGSGFVTPLEEVKDPNAWTFSQNGSVSVTYNRNQGGRDFFVPPRLQLGWDKENVYQLYQNSVFGSLDYDARFDNAAYTGRMHVSGSRDNRYIAGQDDETAVSALYFDGKIKDSGISGRVGRQSQYTGGVLGRFDGIMASVRATEDIKLNAVTGSPVERSRDRPFLSDSYFYGLSADIEHVAKGIDTSVFFVDQRSDGMIDRQGTGAEVRYLDESMSGFATLDYDIHYLELNNAALSGTYIFPGFSTVGLNFDYRRAPLIFTTNALMGQGVASLSDLLKIYTHDDIERFTLDRTAQSVSVGGNFSHPLNEHLTLSGDAIVTYMSGTKASGGVSAMDSTGTEFYSSLQLSNSDLWMPGDYYSGGIRFADTQSSYRYMIEGSVRYPVTKEWRVGPVLRLGYADNKDDGYGEYEFMPSVHSSYYITDDVVFDFEIGEKWTARDTVHGTENETELTVLSGIRYDFHTGD